MNESEYTTPLGTFSCCDCGVAFDGPPRGPKKRRCPECRERVYQERYLLKHPLAMDPNWRSERAKIAAAGRRVQCAGKGGPCPHCGDPMWADWRGVSAVRSCSKSECKRLASVLRGRESYAKKRAERLSNPQPVDKTGWIPCPYCPDLMPPHHNRQQCGKPACRLARNADRNRKFVGDYARRYPEKRRAHRSNRRALERGATGTHTAADVKTQYQRQHGQCFWRNVNPACTVSLKGGYHVDHVVPLGGDRSSSNGPENIVLSCPKCNGSKHAKDPMDWAGVMF